MNNGQLEVARQKYLVSYEFCEKLTERYPEKLVYWRTNIAACLKITNLFRNTAQLGAANYWLELCEQSFTRMDNAGLAIPQDLKKSFSALRNSLETANHLPDPVVNENHNMKVDEF